MSEYNLKQAIMRRDKLSEAEADESIAAFEEEIGELEERNAAFYELEETFSDRFGLELDYLEDYMNNRNK